MFDRFACDICDTVDAVDVAFPNGVPTSGPLKCTCCQERPWHHLFPHRKYDPNSDLVSNRANGIGMG